MEQLSDVIIKDTSTARDSSRDGALKEIEKVLGSVPGFLKMVPANLLEPEWKVMRDFEFSEETALDPKVKELVGVAVAAVLHCRYCSKFHSEAATVAGASPAEINEVLMMAKHTAGWSSYINGSRYDIDKFDKEVDQIASFLKRQRAS